MLETTFWLLLFLSAYSYFIYPALLALLTAGKHEEPTSGPAPFPTMSLIITVHNEERRIEKKLINSLKLSYEHEHLEIIVASDCSDDRTHEIVKKYQDQGVKLLVSPKRLGKEYAQYCAIREARGEVLVFSDAATEIPADALNKLAIYFTHPHIGAVSSEDRLLSQDGKVAGEGAYVKYEMWLRQRESQLAGLIGLSGSFFAVRKFLCQHWDIFSPSDFNTALNCASAGYRSVSAPDVLGVYQDLKQKDKEYERKIRTVIRGLQALMRHPQSLNPFSHGLFAFQLISHKLMRWLEPWFLLGLLLSNYYLIGQGAGYTLLFVLQCGFYTLALGARFFPLLRQQLAIRLIYFFVQVNAAMLYATLRYLRGERMQLWSPSVR